MRFPFALTLAAGALAALLPAPAAAAVGSLASRGCFNDISPYGFGDDCGAHHAEALDGVQGIAVSPDGNSVYVPGWGDNAITTFNRDQTSGALSAPSCIDDVDSSFATCPQSHYGLDGARSVAISPDGTSVYVASEVDDSLAWLRRDTATGALTWRGCVVDDEKTSPDPCTKVADGLEVADFVTVSPDGKSVYVASRGDNAIVRFTRGLSGALTPKGCIGDEFSSDPGCTVTAKGLSEASSIAVSPDGKSLYATGPDSDAIVRLRRSLSGALTPKGCIGDNESSANFEGCTPEVDGLQEVRSVAVSADGRSVYTVSPYEEAIDRFDRNTSFGTLTYQGCVKDNDDFALEPCAQSTDGLDGAYAVAVSPDDASVYVVSDDDNALVNVARDTATGALVPQLGACVEDNDYGPDACAQATNGLGGPRGLALSPDGKSLYTAAYTDSVVARFSRVPAP